MPVVSKGSATYISSSNETALLDLRRFREDIKAIKTKTQGRMPDTIEVKGIHDLVQSILLSITNGNTYKWIICEGSSDKIYLDAYLEGLGVRVLAVGGAPQVKKIFEYLNLAIDAESNSVKGSVLFLVDTDERTSNERISSSKSKKINIKRFININGDTSLIDINSDITSPPTEIEDALEPLAFIETLKAIATIDDPIYQEIQDLYDNIDQDKPSGLAFNYRQTQQDAMRSFFSTQGRKVEFAKKYIQHELSIQDVSWLKNVTELLG